MIPFCIMAIESEDDREFMEKLYINYQRLMYSEIFKITRDQWVTEDLLQDTITKLIDKVEELREKERKQLINYIISSCKNRAFNYVTREGKRVSFSLDECMDAPSAEYDRYEMERTLIHTEDLDRLAAIWPDMDERSRYVLEAHYILEKSNEEIAKDLGICPNSVRMALTRARKTAYKLLEEGNN